jgi:hypothetical protein
LLPRYDERAPKKDAPTASEQPALLGAEPPTISDPGSAPPDAFESLESTKGRARGAGDDP